MTQATSLRELPRPSERRFRPWLIAIAVIGLALRVLYTFTLSPPLPPLSDDSFYYYASNLIAQGHGYAQPYLQLFHGQLVPTALHPPLWPALLAVISLFTAPAEGVGQFSGAAFELHRVVGCVCGAVVVVLVGLLGRRLGGWRVGLVAAGLAAVYPHFIVLDGTLLSEPLYAALVGGLMVAAYAFRTRPTPGRALSLGILVGLAALTRQEGLLFVPVLLLPLAWRTGASRLLLSGMAVLGVALIIVPWTVRNYSVFHRVVPVANSGAVVGGANCPATYYGAEIGSWQISCLRDPHPSPDEAVESARVQSRGVNYAQQHVARAVLVAGVRFLRIWSLYAPTGQSFGEKTVVWVGVVFFYCVLLAAGYALVLLRRRRQRVWILVTPVMVVALTAILGDGLDRLRYPAEVPLLALCAVTVVTSGARIRHPAAPRRRLTNLSTSRSRA